jgi:cytochrome P450
MPPVIREEAGDDYVFPLTSQLAITDPPQHTRIRKLIQPAWTPRALEAFEPDIRKIADGLLDQFVADGRADIKNAFASPIPPLVIARLVGAPPEMAQQFMKWIPSFFMLSGTSSLPEEESIAAWQDVLAVERYTRKLIAEHRAEPRDDLTTEMIEARGEDGEPALTDQEIMGNLLGFIGAGSDTTALLIAHTLYFLLQRPDDWERVKSDPVMLKKAIEETLRFKGSTVSIKRTTTRPTTLAGVEIPEGAHLWVNLSAADRDEKVFERPDEFDIDRSDVAAHLGLGKWTHFCLGGPLARIETRIALECVIERLPDLRLAPDQGPLEYSLNMVIPEIERLEVEWTAP